MSRDEWIVVPSWDRFQHYKDRVPNWIKLYTAELAHDHEWESLSAGCRGTLVTIWVEYALHKGQLPAEAVSKSLGRSYKVAYLDSLNDAGFIELVASKPLALTRSREEDSKESSKKRRRSPKRSGGASSEEKQLALAEAEHLAQTWNGGDSDAFAAAVDEIARRHHVGISDAQRIDLWNSAFEW